jgi:hypothetical protein
MKTITKGGKIELLRPLINCISNHRKYFFMSDDLCDVERSGVYPPPYLFELCIIILIIKSGFF